MAFYWLKKKLSGFCLLLALISTAAAQESSDLDAATLWQALATGGHVVLMRHAYAPGTGDPAHFELDDCATQRNLNDAGREQARRTGAAFRERDIQVGKVLSSQWCRCRETAELLTLGPVEPLPALNSFFAAWQRRDTQTQQLRDYIATLERNGSSVVMVTHQVNISALTGRPTASGGMVVLRLKENGDFTVAGTIPAL